MKVAIVGAGKLGIRVTTALLGGDHSITIVDKNEEYIDFRWDKWGQEKFYKIIGFDEVYKLK